LNFDVLIVGGGIIGCAVARQLVTSNSGLNVGLLEKERTLAFHTSGRNSGVIHSGFNQAPGTLKAKFCVDGNARLRAYCRAKGVEFEECGTLVVSRSDRERRVIQELERRGRTNGVPGLKIIDREELSRLEPNVAPGEALCSPTGCIVDSRGLVFAIAREVEERGAELIKGVRVVSLREEKGGVRVVTTAGEMDCKLLINCAGLHADRIARMLGLSRRYSIVPFRGQYYRLRDEKRGVIRSMVYPPPDLEFPFLGVHLTKRVNGDVLIGPNATLVGGREGYSITGYSVKDSFEMVSFPGFLKAALNPRFAKLVLRELYTSASRKRFVDLAKGLVPLIDEGDIVADTAGIRAQLLNDRGNLVDDFVLECGRSSIHVLNSVSPGMTCAMPFAEYVVRQAWDRGYLAEG
jgi:L-2-hydroxyglutarate oxidase